MYHLFDGMPDLIVALLERTFERLYAALNDAAASATSAEGLVRAIVTTHLEWVLANRSEARFMYQALALELGSPTRKQLGRLKAELKIPMQERLRELGVHHLVAAHRLLEVVIFGPTHQACRWLLMGSVLDEEWLRRELPTIAWARAHWAQR